VTSKEHNVRTFKPEIFMIKPSEVTKLLRQRMGLDTPPRPGLVCVTRLQTREHTDQVILVRRKWRRRGGKEYAQAGSSGTRTFLCKVFGRVMADEEVEREAQKEGYRLATDAELICYLNNQRCEFYGYGRLTALGSYLNQDGRKLFLTHYSTRIMSSLHMAHGPWDATIQEGITIEREGRRFFPEYPVAFLLVKLSPDEA
jgi:hypothetical protein